MQSKRVESQVEAAAVRPIVAPPYKKTLVGKKRTKAEMIDGPQEKSSLAEDRVRKQMKFPLCTRVIQHAMDLKSEFGSKKPSASL